MAYHNPKDYELFKRRQNMKRECVEEGPFLKALRKFPGSKGGQGFLIGATIAAITYLSFREQINDIVETSIDVIGNSIHQSAHHARAVLYETADAINHAVPLAAPPAPRRD